MSNLDHFQAYADAFEETYRDDNWQRLERYFAPDAIYVSEDGAQPVGRDQVLEHLREGVNGLDRRFDSRQLEPDPPAEAGDTVSFAWRLTLSKEGLPELIISGVEHLTYVDGVIIRMEDVADQGTMEQLGAWMASHGESLDS